MRTVKLLATLLLLTACDAVEVDPTRIACEPDVQGHGCPDGYDCVDGFCARASVDGDHDGTPSGDDTGGDALDGGDHVDEPEAGTWTAITSPTAQDLNAIWGHYDGSSTLAWAVGENGTIIHYNGSQWQQTIVALAGDTALNAVHGTTADDLWVVGDSGLILHWDGLTWASTTSGTTNNLLAVWAAAPAFIWAVGWHTTILRGDGTTWADDLMGLTDNSDLRAVWGSGATDVWCSGYVGAMLHRTGGLWADSESPAPNPDIHAISGACDGSLTLFAGAGFVIKRYAQDVWSVDTTPPGGISYLYGMAGITDACSGFRAVGSNGTILQEEDGRWYPELVGSTATLRGVWGHLAGGGLAWAVGDGGVILSYQPPQ